MNVVEKMKKDWNRRAAHDARYWIATEDYRTEEEFDRSGDATAVAILRLVNESRGDVSAFRVLEIGCGVGRVLRRMAPFVRELVGIDVSEEMIARSVEWLDGAPNVETRATSGVDLDGLDDDSFDLVFSYVSFQHMPREVFARYLMESQRVLRPGGYLAFQIYLGPLQQPPLGDTIALRIYSEEELEEELRSASFRIERRTLEHRTNEGLESWLVLASQSIAHVSGSKAESDLGWVERECGEPSSPMDYYLYRNLAQNQLADGNKEAAIETMKRHLEFDSAALTVSIELAALLVEAGRAEEAIEVLEAATNVHPDYAEAYLGLVQLLVMSGRRSEALDVVDRIHAGFPDERALHDRAKELIAATPVPSGV